MKYTFDDQIFSDLVKEVYGTRSVGRTGHLSHYHVSSDAEKQKIWDDLCDQHEEVMAEEAKAEKRSIARFEARIQETIVLGAGNRETALRWILEGEFGDEMSHWPFDAGYACYIFNLPYSFEKEFEPIVREAYAKEAA